MFDRLVLDVEVLYAMSVLNGENPSSEEDRRYSRPGRLERALSKLFVLSKS